MKRPILSEYERKVIRFCPDSLTANQYKGFLARKNFERALSKTYLFRCMDRFVNWLNDKLIREKYGK